MTTIKNNITEKILSLLELVGILAVAVVAPNLVQIIDKPQYKKYKFDKKKYQKSLYYLKQKEFIKQSKSKKGEILKLTEKGRIHALKYLFLHFALNKPENWDGLWRVVGFDVPNLMKIARDALRGKLKMLKFYQLQKSVFVSPYPCEKEIKFLKRIYKVEPYVRLLLVKSIDNEKELLQHFNLKK